MNKRGKILRDTSMGPGLILIDGQQYPFNLEGVWKADIAPKVNMVVAVELDEANQISAVHAVGDSQLAKEQAEVAMKAAKEKGTQLATGLLAKFGPETLIGIALLAISWLFFNTISVRESANFASGISFWNILSVLNSPFNFIRAFASGESNGLGIYHLLAIIALLAPLLPYFWKDPRAYLGGLLPVVFVVFVGIMVYVGINDAGSQIQGAASIFGGQRAAQMASQFNARMTHEFMQAISIGIGGYLSLLVCLYFAGKGVMKYLAAKA